MKTRIFTYMALAALLASVSCRKESEFTGTPELEGGGVVLSFVCADTDTKTTMAGEDAYHENTLTTIDYFLYPEGQTGSNAYLKGRVTMNGRTSYNVLVNTSQLSTLFSGAAVHNKCDVFAIANYPEEITGPTDVESLKRLAMTTHFNGQAVPTDFVMCGQTKAEVINKNKTKAAEGTVTLTRAASKVTFECRIANSVTITNKITSGDEIIEQDITWVPLVAQMKAYLVHSFSSGTVGGTEAAMDEGALDRYAERTLTDADSNGWYTCDPFYSYPQSWNDGDEREPFIKLMVPWAYLNEQGQQAGQKQFYYKVPCPGLNLAANTWYHIKLDVAILGGDDFEAMLTVQGEYYVMPWNTQTIVQADAEIKDARYISVPSRTYNMYNIKDLEVLITSSHDAEMNLKSVTYYDYVNKTNIDYTSTATSSNPKWITYDDEDRTFTINHTLNNDVTDNGFDSSPYVFTFEIRHKDDNTYTTGDIVVTQYPAMYINDIQSNKYAYINGQVNGNSQVTAYDDHNNSLSVLVDRRTINDSGDNTNSHMYRINVTTVAGMNYTIGDPRLWATQNVTTLDNLGADYMEAAEINEDMIAPQFMVASSTGKSQPLSYKYAATRCAAYQENGFPAGRWRVPTKAEIMFLIQLSEKGKIPTLFTPDTDMSNGAYWCSSGVVYPLKNGNVKTVEYRNFTDAASICANNWVRCVYDTWYWGEDPIEAYKTTWGGYHTTSQPVE
jgi:hypothetical protein